MKEGALLREAVSGQSIVDGPFADVGDVGGVGELEGRAEEDVNVVAAAAAVRMNGMKICLTTDQVWSFPPQPRGHN